MSTTYRTGRRALYLWVANYYLRSIHDLYRILNSYRCYIPGFRLQVFYGPPYNHRDIHIDIIKAPTLDWSMQSTSTPKNPRSPTPNIALQHATCSAW